jgi:hypothetical protein
MVVISTLGRLKLKYPELEASLGYIVSSRPVWVSKNPQSKYALVQVETAG